MIQSRVQRKTSRLLATRAEHLVCGWRRMNKALSSRCLPCIKPKNGKTVFWTVVVFLALLRTEPGLYGQQTATPLYYYAIQNFQSGEVVRRGKSKIEGIPRNELIL